MSDRISVIKIRLLSKSKWRYIGGRGDKVFFDKRLIKTVKVLYQKITLIYK